MLRLLDADAEQRLHGYFDKIGSVLGRKERRASFAIYAKGILGDGERKSVEPIAARACPDPVEVERLYDNLLSFLVDSNWSDRDVRRSAAQVALDAIQQREPVEAWIIDDTGFLKQGTHSVGVQRQYTGSAGKIANCQIGVSLAIASATEHVPIDFELYLPESWTEDPARRAEARIPEHIQFRTKPQLALEMIGRAIDDGIEYGVVLADSAYGDSTDFRDSLDGFGLEYSVGVKGPTKVFPAGEKGCPFGEAISVAELGRQLRFRRVTWRDGTKEMLWSRFARVRVVAAHDNGIAPSQRRAQWLLVEWPRDEPAPTKYTLSTLSSRTSMRRLVRMTKERWRTERIYEDLKGELGLDHYEGRRFPGWHHHVSVVLCCYAFIVAERARHFPPSRRRTGRAGSIALAA